ncbi:cellulose biosynthesis protein BcsQ [Pseudomonas sp. HY2-MNA-CIBAN-0224]|uniref:cellulose biosynthesis protein BcsQ n=1 Tax=Pseudomonas sp. HY2-MNA-CIBAN-0224 TaxID=3140471 RepID=UPI00332F1EC5
MNRTDDISNLFGRFGASAESYHEFDSQVDFKETQPAQEQEEMPSGSELAPVPGNVPLDPVAEVLEELIEPVQVDVHSSLHEVSSVSSAPVVVGDCLPVVEACLASELLEVEAAALPVPTSSTAEPTALPEVIDAGDCFEASATGAEFEQSVEFRTPQEQSFSAVTSVTAPSQLRNLLSEIAQERPAIEAAGQLLAAEEASESGRSDVLLVEQKQALPAVPPVTAPGQLRNLLAEVVLARQAEAQLLAEEALRQAAARGRPAKCKAHIVVMISLKGGVGKTTLSAGLVSSLRLKGGRALAIDLDPQNALQYHLGVEHSVSGFGSSSMAGLNWSERWQRAFNDALLLPYGILSEDERSSLIKDMTEDRHWLARQLDSMNLDENDVVVIDTATGNNLALMQALDVADEVLVVTTADASSFMALDQIDGVLGESDARPAYSRCSYLVNQFDASREFSRDMLQVLKRRLGEQLMAVISLDHTLGEALAYGRNPFSTVEPSPACEDVLNLAKQLKARFEATPVQGIEG